MAIKLPDYLHLIARLTDGQWVVECLDFDLAAQDDTLEAAQRRVLDQASSYVEEALAMDGGAHAEQLLSRRAPLWDWMVFYFMQLRPWQSLNQRLKPFTSLTLKRPRTSLEGNG
jgi:hypothetical protein